MKRKLLIFTLLVGCATPDTTSDIASNDSKSSSLVEMPEIVSLDKKMANYFDIFYCLSLSIILKHEIINSQERLAISTLAYIGFTIFYIMYYLKYLNAEQYASSWLSDFYKHVSFFELFK